MINLNTTSYEKRLHAHINRYLQLVTDYPSVRYQEFHALVEYADLENPERILEVPAEGKVLETFYPDAMIARADLVPVESATNVDCALTDWSLSEIKNHYYDAVLALAPIHHANTDQKKQYIEGVYDCLKDGGVIAFGEVEQASSLSVFLDEFVDQHSYTNHQGEYPETNFSRVLQDAHFKNVTSDRLNCNWIFDNETQLCNYITQLFGLRPMDEKLLLTALSELLGFEKVGERIHLNWQLLFFRGVK